MSKIRKSLRKAIEAVGLESGMTVSFHHHLRNGDFVMNMVMDEIADMGISDIRVAASSFFPVHGRMVRHIKSGVVTALDCNYMSGPLAEAVTSGMLEKPVMFRTHGGRSRAIL